MSKKQDAFPVLRSELADEVADAQNGSVVRPNQARLFDDIGAMPGQFTGEPIPTSDMLRVLGTRGPNATC